MNKLFASLALFALTFAAFPAPTVHASTTVHAGDLIRGETFSAVYYYGEDGFRYVFPNEKTYFTWYSNFDDVVMLTDAELGKIQIGGNVTYKPESRMIKINTDPKVYFVGHNGSLYWVSSESLAASLYGSTWNKKIDDVADAFFSNYTLTGEEATITSRADGDISMAWTVSSDKDLTAYTEMGIYVSAYGVPSKTISAGETVMFKNYVDMKHTATADDNSWGTGTLNEGDTFVRRFDTPGTYTFHCSYHTSMTGTIIVE